MIFVIKFTSDDSGHFVLCKCAIISWHIRRLILVQFGQFARARSHCERDYERKTKRARNAYFLRSELAPAKFFLHASTVLSTFYLVIKYSKVTIIHKTYHDTREFLWPQIEKSKNEIPELDRQKNAYISPFQLQITASVRDRPLRATWALLLWPTWVAAADCEPTLIFVIERGFIALCKQSHNQRWS